jgi:hypothetical protein
MSVECEKCGMEWERGIGRSCRCNSMSIEPCSYCDGADSWLSDHEADCEGEEEEEA